MDARFTSDLGICLTHQAPANMDALLEHLWDPVVAVPLALLVIYFIYGHLTAVPPVPTGLPWIGRDPSKLFSESRASLASFNNIRQWLNEGYEKIHSPPSSAIAAVSTLSELTNINKCILRNTKPTSSLTSLANPKSSFLARRYIGYLISPIMSSALQNSTTMPSRVFTPSPILISYKTHIMNMLCTNSFLGNLGQRYRACGKSFLVLSMRPGEWILTNGGAYASGRTCSS